MSKVTIVSTVTYAVEVDVPLGFLVDEKALASSQSKELKAAVRSSLPHEAKLLSLGATTTVVAGHTW